MGYRVGGHCRVGGRQAARRRQCTYSLALLSFKRCQYCSSLAGILMLYLWQFCLLVAKKVAKKGKATDSEPFCHRVSFVLRAFVI